MIDSHNHIHFRAFRNDLAEVMRRAASAGMSAMLAVGIDPADCRKALAVAGAYTGVYVSLGIHPQNGGRYTGRDVQALKGLFTERVVAIGETGFDLYRTPESEQAQRELFIRHVELAFEMRLPLIIHDRSAHEQTVSVLDETGAWGLGGVFHCFSGDRALAQAVVDKGFLVSIPGVITFRNADVLREVAREIPLAHLLVETDAPYLAPEPFRGKRNEPAYTMRTIEEIARVRQTSPEEVARATADNFSRVFLAGRPADPPGLQIR